MSSNKEVTSANKKNASGRNVYSLGPKKPHLLHQEMGAHRSSRSLPSAEECRSLIERHKKNRPHWDDIPARTIWAQELDGLHLQLAEAKAKEEPQWAPI